MEEPGFPLITKIDPGSPADEAGIRVGDRLASLNGEIMRDVIDYQLAREADKIDFELIRGDSRFHVRLDRNDERPIGLAFEKSLFDREKLCQNQCLFCFIDQLPPDCRPTLYIKDDDFRLSFLYGNFITLTNLRQADLERIKEQRLSPLYVSIHSTDPEVRRRLICPPKVDKALENLKALMAIGVEVHVQIVACPELNTGAHLEETLEALFTDYADISSVGIVPVGLTGHRAGLPDIRGFSKAEASDLLDQVRNRQEQALKIKGYRWVYAADEFYLLADEKIPPAQNYDDFPQVENGIGIARLFKDEIDDWLEENGSRKIKSGGGKMSVVTAASAAPVVDNSLRVAGEFIGCEFEVITAKNDWLGGDVTVAGLLSGSDIIKAINGLRPSGPVLIPDICLNPDGLFLDDLSVEDVIKSAGVEVTVVPSTGWDLMEALVGVR